MPTSFKRCSTAPACALFLWACGGADCPDGTEKTDSGRCLAPADATVDSSPGDGATDAPADATGDAPDDAGPCGGCADGVCDPDTGTCVACLGDDDCTGAGAPACGTEAGEPACVECTGDTHCDGDTPRCDTDASECVECVENADCTDPTASLCDGGSCVPCTGNPDCDHLDGLGVCDSSDDPATCVECTGTDFGDCDGVCDSRMRTCTSMPAADKGLCEGCVSDAQCREGMLCIPMTFEPSDGGAEEEVGTFCLWRQDASVTDAPDGACSTVPPYVAATEATSLDGETTTVCSLRTTTCPGLNDFDTDCADPSMDDLCGETGFDDGLCVVFDAASNKCTVPCGGDDDCKAGFSCDTTVTPNRCEL